jgi:nitrate reductase alpha subunit
VRRYTDMPMLVMLKEHTLPDGEVITVPDRYVRARTSTASWARPTTPSGRRWPSTRTARWCCPTAPSASAGAQDGRADQGQWNLEAKEARHGNEVKLKLSVLEGEQASAETAGSAFPTSAASPHENFPTTWPGRPDAANDVLVRTVPVQRISLGKAGEERSALVATVFDLQVANYGVAARPAGRAGRHEL